MSRVTGSKPSFLGGLYQVPSKDVPDNGVIGICDNVLLSRHRGAHMRPPSWHKGIIDPDLMEPTADLFTHHVKRSETDRYSVVVMGGELLVYDSVTGAQKTVVIPQSFAASNYLDTVTGFRAVTIGDTTILANRDKVVRRLGNRRDLKRYEATIQVREANYSNTYSVRLGNYEVRYTTQLIGTVTADRTLATEVVARGIYSKMKTDKYLAERYVVTYFGNVLHLTRKDGEDFKVAVADSLGDNGLKLVKDTVQVFEDLPPVAKEGMVVRIVGDLTTGKDDYWVEFRKTKDYEELGGTWVEVPAPGASLGLDWTTMPWALTRYGSQVGKRTVLRDPFAPTIRSYHWRDRIDWNTSLGPGYFAPVANASGWDVSDQSTEVCLFEDVSSSAELTLSHPGIGTVNPWMALVHFDVDASELEPGQVVYVRLQRKDGSSWGTKDQMFFPAGSRAQNCYLRTPLAADDPLTHPWRVTLFYFRPAGSPTDLFARVYLHSGTHPTHPGIFTVPRPSYSVTYDPDVVYPEGHVEKLAMFIFVPNEIPGSSNYTLRAEVTVTGSGMLGSEMQAAMVDAINAAAAGAIPPGTTFSAVNNGELGLWIYKSTEPYFGGLNGGSPNLAGELFYVERDNTKRDSAFLMDGPLNFAAGTLIGMTVRNITDGSTAAVEDHRHNQIMTTTLDGGYHNKYTPGDEIEIIGETGDYFVFDAIRWGERLAGDDVSVPMPSFVDKRISDVFFHGNRLGLCAGENVVLSASGDLFRFFRRTASDLLPDDPVDVRHSYKAIAAFDSAVEWEGSMFLFSEAGHQFRLSGDPVITPSTVRIDHVGSHPCSAIAFRPVAIGSKLYFSRKVQDYSRIMEGSLSQDADGNLVLLAKDITTHVPRYLKGNVVDMAGDSSAGLLGVLTDGDNRENIYMWSFEPDEQGNPLNAWCRWTFGDPVWAMDMAEGHLWIAVVRQPTPVYGYGGVCLEAIDLVTPTSQLDTLHWDRQGLLNISSPYTLRVGLPNFYATRPDGTRDVIGQLVIQYVNIHYFDAGLLVTKVRTRARPSGAEYSLFTTGNKIGTMRVPVMARNGDYSAEAADFTLQCDHFYGIGLSGLDWEGYYEKRHK